MSNNPSNQTDQTNQPNQPNQPNHSVCGPLVQAIVNAIIRQEGAPIDSTNPGNIRKPGWLTGPIPVENGFWKPTTRAEGVAGIVHIVSLRIAERMSLAQLITSYAPPSDHNATTAYIKNVATWIGLKDVLNPLYAFLLLETPAKVVAVELSLDDQIKAFIVDLPPQQKQQP